MIPPTQTCKVCGAVEVAEPSGRGFPPDNAKRALKKRCAAAGHVSQPFYIAGFAAFDSSGQTTPAAFNISLERDA